MNFGSPEYSWLLLLAAAGVGVVAWWTGWLARARRTFGLGGAIERSRFVAPLLLIGAVALIAIAAARPQAGSHDVEVEQRGVDMVVVLDVSNSMLADDVKPTRLAVAQREIDALLERMQGSRVGLVIFAGAAFDRSPQTADVQALQTIVDGIGDDRTLLPPGSDLGSAIRAAQTALKSGTAETKAMLIVSDGEDHGAGVSAAVDAARLAGIRLYTAGAGTAQGSPVRDVDRTTGVVTDRVDASGNTVVTRLDAAALQGIASAGGGRYIALSGDGPPLSGFAAELKALTQTAFGTKQSSVPIERFQIVALLALVLLAAELVWPVLRRPSTLLRSATRMWPLAGAGLLIGAVCSATVASVNRHGNNDYARGDYEASIALYRTAEAMAPSHGEPYHNAGNAFDQQGAYDKAIAETLRALPAQQALVSQLEYALGNHYVGASKLSEALEAYKRALLADPSDADAKHNLEIVTARLTPSPSPTPTPGAQPTPPPNATVEPGSSPGDPQQSGTPAPPGSDAGATPGAGDRGLATSDLERELSDALAGKDKQFTEDEAIRVLQLLDEANRRAVEQQANSAIPSGPPDY